MKFLLLAIAYPDIAVDKSIYTDLAQELAALGHDVRVVAPAAARTRGRLNREGQVDVLRVNTGALFNTSLVIKGLRNAFLPNRYLRAITRHFGAWRADWIIVPTPPITLAPVVKRLKARWNARVYLLLRDIFPQNAVDLGIMKDGGLTFRYFSRLESSIYDAANVIGCMSPANKEYLVRRHENLDSSKLRILPNWIGLEEMELNSASQSWRDSTRTTWGFDNKYVCIFGGNLGRPQGVDFLIKAAEALLGDEEIKFVVVGEGTERCRLRRLIEDRKLTNISMHPKMERSEFQSFLSAADLGLVLLSDRFSIPNIPSRLLGYWAAGLPVLAATDTATDLNEAYLKRFRAGKWVRMGDVSAFAAAVRWFKRHPVEAAEMGTRGRIALQSHYTVGAVCQRLIEHTAPSSGDHA